MSTLFRPSSSLHSMSRVSSVAPWGIALLAGSWLVVESAFYLAFHLYLVPRANRRTSPRPFRSPVDRRQYLDRMVQRILRDNNIPSVNDVQAKRLFARYLIAWFRKTDKHASSSSIAENIIILPDGTWMVPGLARKSIVKLYAWAFYTKEVLDLTSEEWAELEDLVAFLTDTLHQRFDDTEHFYEPRRLSLENVEALHRPLAVYGAASLLQCTAGVVLRIAGFARIRSPSTGLTGWYRPGEAKSFLPVVFFHGIAPAGLSFYLPMLHSVVPSKAPCFLFDNPNIACSIQFSALNEEETARGVQELLDQYCGVDTPFIVAGHSFGSCPVSWLLLNDKLALRIQKAVLLEPVTILLHESDLTMNFFYAEKWNKIRVAASSELFTQTYLRRHFAWYNSDLWLDAVKVPVVVALSGQDSIVPTPKVLRHVQNYEHVRVVHWKNSRHGDCLIDPKKWRDLKGAVV